MSKFSTDNILYITLIHIKGRKKRGRATPGETTQFKKKKERQKINQGGLVEQS